MNQVLVYGQVLHADRVVLVYPEEVRDHISMPAGFRDIDVVGFELAGTPEEIDARATALVEHLLKDVLVSVAA